MAGPRPLRRTGRPLVLAVTLAGVLNAVLLGAAPPARATSKRLTANVLAGLDALQSMAVSPATPMQVALALSRPDPGGEKALYQRLYQPGSSDYRHFLSPAQFDQRFGVAPTTYDRAVAWLRAGGLSVDTPSRSHH